MTTTKKEWNLKAETELRLLIAENERLSIQLIEGSAELFGIEVEY